MIGPEEIYLYRWRNTIWTLSRNWVLDNNFERATTRMPIIQRSPLIFDPQTGHSETCGTVNPSIKTVTSPSLFKGIATTSHRDIYDEAPRQRGLIFADLPNSFPMTVQCGKIGVSLLCRFTRFLRLDQANDDDSDKKKRKKTWMKWRRQTQNVKKWKNLGILYFAFFSLI